MNFMNGVSRLSVCRRYLDCWGADRKNGVDGDLIEMDGYAYYKDESEPGKLTVHLNGLSMDAPYWVVALGDEDGVGGILNKTI